MKVKLILARTLWDPEMTWKDTGEEERVNDGTTD